MNTQFLQIMIVIWIGAHPVTHTLPHLYEATDSDTCWARAEQIWKHRKPKARVIVTCETTDKRSI